MERTSILIIFCCIAIMGSYAQTDLIMNFDYDADGPWNDPDLTTFTAPQVPVDSIVLDGEVSAAEYGGFESIEIIPVESGWPIAWPGER